jgi:hypothetical protein
MNVYELSSSSDYTLFIAVELNAMLFSMKRKACSCSVKTPLKRRVRKITLYIFIISYKQLIVQVFCGANGCYIRRGKNIHFKCTETTKLRILIPESYPVDSTYTVPTMFRGTVKQGCKLNLRCEACTINTYIHTHIHTSFSEDIRADCVIPRSQEMPSFGTVR